MKNSTTVAQAQQKPANLSHQPMPDALTISIKVDGQLVEVARRHRDGHGNLHVAWSVPAADLSQELLYLQPAPL